MIEGNCFSTLEIPSRQVIKVCINALNVPTVGFEINNNNVLIEN